MMARKDTKSAITKVGATNGAPPAYLQKYAEDATKLATEMSEYRVVPRVKIIQQMTRSEVKSKFGEGWAILTPGDRTIAEYSDDKDEVGRFQFVPLFFSTEFCKWADRKDEGSNSILERTFDKGSDLARRSRDANLRLEPYGEPKKKGDAPPFKYRYVEHLNFIGFIYNGPLVGELVTVSFSRGEFSQGKNFISATMMRRGVPLWAQVWEFNPAKRSRSGNEWYGLDFRIPEFEDRESAIILEEEVEKFREGHEELKRLQEARALIVDQSDTDDDEGVVSTNTKM